MHPKHVREDLKLKQVYLLDDYHAHQIIHGKLDPIPMPQPNIAAEVIKEEFDMADYEPPSVTFGDDWN